MKLTAQYVICLQHMCNTLASLGKLKKPCPKVHERVMEKRQALYFLPVLAVASFLIKISGSSSLRPVLTGPDLAFSGPRVVFRCVAPNVSPPVIYELIKDGRVRIGRDRDFHGGQVALFPIKVTAASEGSYHCRATAGGTREISNSIKLRVVTPPSYTRVTSEPFPPVAYEGSRMALSCDVEMGSHLSYSWFFNRKEITSSTSLPFHFVGNKLLVERVTPEYAGNYSCSAWTSVNEIKRISSSTEVQVTIKVYVSKPEISFSVHKEGTGYHGNVTCWSTRGSPPVNFYLLLDGKEVDSATAAQTLAAWFLVVVVPELDMGEARCRVKTENQDLTSEPVNLEVVPVGGNVKVEVEYLYTADSKLTTARLSCHVSRGTFPYISWLFNDSVLPSESHPDSHIQPILPHIAFADRRRSLVLTKLSPEESGYYRCRARDNYDDAGPWVESAAELVQVTVNSMSQAESSTETPPSESFCMNITEAVTITFCCFVLLILVVGSACVYKMFENKQAHTNSVPANSDALQSELTHQSGGNTADTTATDCDVQNQITEVTV
ncbi:Fc receptor-like protein 5 isoform X2 [Oreochromis aureus]|uniref:Fc receptor-like protein 5 isoform X2 n=1 Tax=Oreochromis aureus TaxID=47969 RepID=UPI001952F871|nr:Fc receptor-like protein 5 isoform X2 [Oreochromis aureus]